jgi:hypothetical protein
LIQACAATVVLGFAAAAGCGGSVLVEKDGGDGGSGGFSNDGGSSSVAPTSNGPTTTGPTTTSVTSTYGGRTDGMAHTATGSQRVSDAGDDGESGDIIGWRLTKPSGNVGSMKAARASHVALALMICVWSSSGCDSSGTTTTQATGGDGGQSTSTQTSNGGGGSTSTSAGGDATGGGGSGAGGASTGGGGSAPAVPGCVEACTAVADCTSPSPIFDDDNYACSNNRCEYKGCNSSQECIDAFQSPNWVCE